MTRRNVRRTVLMIVALLFLTLSPAIARGQGSTPQADNVKKAITDATKLSAAISGNCTEHCVVRAQQGPDERGRDEETLSVEVELFKDASTAQAVFDSRIGELNRLNAAWETKYGRKALESVKLGSGASAWVGIAKQGMFDPVNKDGKFLADNGAWLLMVCANLTVAYSRHKASALIYDDPARANDPDWYDKLYAEAVRIGEESLTQVKGTTQALAKSLSTTGACPGAGVKPALELYPLAILSSDSVKQGDKLRIEGVVWARENGVLKDHVQAKLEVQEDEGLRTVPFFYTSEADGHFDIEFTVRNLYGNPNVQVRIVAISPDPTRYADGELVYHLAGEIKGGLVLTLSADKAVYNLGEPVTISGNVTTSDGQPVQAQLSISNDGFAVAASSDTNTGGGFNHAFTPGSELKRPPGQLVLPGVHLVTVNATAPAYTERDAVVMYTTNGNFATDGCIPLEATVAGLSGTSKVFEVQPNVLNNPFARPQMLQTSTRLAQGLGVETEGGARVALHFDLEGRSGLTSVYVVLNASTTLKIGRLCKDAQGKLHALFAIDKPGQVEVNVANADLLDGPLNLQFVTPAVAVKSIKTRYFINVDNTGTTTVAALEGTVLVASPDGTNGIELPAPNVTVVRPGEKPDAAKNTPINGQIDPALEAMLGAAKAGAVPAAPIAQPNTNVTRMTLQAAQRSVVAGDLVLIPVWLIKGQNVANLNVQLHYDANIVRPEGAIMKGDLLNNALFTSNAAQSGTVLAAFAQTSGIADIGTVFNISFRVVGKPGDRTPIDIAVTAINDQSGARLSIDRIPGEIVIVNDNGTLPPGNGGGGTGGANVPGGILEGDCDGDGALTELDALCALEMSTGIRPVHLFVDMDNSGDVTSRDAVIILQRAVGK